MGDDGQLTIEKIVEAVMALPPIQWAMQKMAEPESGPGGMDQLTPPSPSAAAPAPGPAPGAAPPPPGAPPGPADGPPAPGEGENLDDIQDLLGDQDPNAGPQAADDDQDPEKEKDTMAAYTAANDHALVERYTALQKSQDALVRQLGQATGRLQSLERESADAKRLARYTQFRADHPQFPADDDELKPCLYAQGGNMTDQQFDAHMATLEKYAAKWVANVQIPTGEAERPATDSTKEQYGQRRTSRAIELYQAARGSDHELDWGQALAAAEQELKGG